MSTNSRNTILVVMASLCTALGLLSAVPAYAGAKEDCQQSTSVKVTMKACTKVLAAEPRNAAAYYRRGLGHLEMYKPDLAFADFNKAIEFDANYADAYVGRGRARPAKDNDLSVAEFTKAIELDPKNAQAYFERADTYSFALPDRAERMIVDLSKAIELNPEFAWAYVSRAMAYGDIGQVALAKADFAKAFDLDPRCTKWVLEAMPELFAEIQAERNVR
jgi:tetratricopeptide (TPR) repeat protein